MVAQPREGSIIISPSYGLTGKKDDFGEPKNEIDMKKDELLSFGFTPRISYLLSSRVAVGASIKYGKKIIGDENGKLNLFTTGPIIRYYILNRKISPYLETEAGMGKYNESGSDMVTYKSVLFYFSGGGGAEFFISPSFSLDMGINYKNTIEYPDLQSVKKTENSWNFGLRAGLSMHLNPGHLSSKNKKPGKSWIL